MSRISERIRGILKSADSSKVADRKRCVTELLDLYQNDDILKEICLNTKRRTCGIVNWSYIMHTVHKLVLSEAERPGKETCTKQKERQTISGLVINTVRHSNERSTELLKSSEIIPMILQILVSKLYVHYQDTYLGILVKYILPKNTNHKDITAEQWKELLIICIKLYKREHLKKNIVLNALQMIVEYSYLYVNLLNDMKDLLLFLEDVFEDAKGSDEQLTKSFYKLANSVCKQIKTESRIALCKFSESILMDMLRLNSSEEKYELLLVFLQIHYPEDTLKCDTYAYDWDKWKNILRSMCLLIQENCKLDVQWPGFVQFASEVVKQVIHNAEANLACSIDVYDDSSRSPLNKSRRIINKMENIMELITESSPEKVWSWLRIITETLKKYPRCLRTQELASLLQYVTELVQFPLRTSESAESVTNNLYKLAAVLMKNEMSTGEVQDATIHWSKIWDMLLRSLGANQNEKSSHALARCFIRHNKMPNANAILRLYLTKGIRWSPNSVRTLLQLCKCISLPEDASTSVLEPSPSSTLTCDRTRLLEWLLNIPWQKLMARLPVDDICALSVIIILSSRCRQNVGIKSVSQDGCLQSHEETHKVISTSRNIYRSDFTQLCYSSLAFKTELLACPKNECIEIDSRVVSNGPVSYVQETFNFLKKRLQDILQEETVNNEVCVVLMKLALLARLLSVLKQLDVLTENIADHTLINTLEKYLRSSFEVLAQIDSTKCKYMYLVSMIRALTILYGGTYDTDIARIIVSATTENMLRNIFDLLNVEDIYVADYQHNCDCYEEHDADQDERRSSVACSESSSGRLCESAIHLRVVETLTSFCTLYTGKNKYTLQTKTMKNLLTTQQDFTSYTDVRMSLMILESLARCDQEDIQRERRDTPLEFLLAICQKSSKDEEILHRLLSLLPFFFEYAMKYRYSPRRIIESLSAFYKHIHKRNCGVSMHIDYMKCVCNIVRIDPDFSWSANSSEEATVMLDSILGYIGHPLFLLRAHAVRYLQEFLSLEKLTYEKKERMFIMVMKTVLELLKTNHQLNFHFRSENSLEVCQREDEKETRTATALIALASVACSNEVFQGRALHAMLQLIIEREINVEKVRRVLSAAMQQIMCPSLVEDNLNYLLTTWIDSKYPLQKFPWMLMECESADEFFKNHINRIIPLLLRTSDLNEAVTFCNNINIAFSVVFEDVFPSCLVWLIFRVCDQSASSVDNVAIQTLRKLQNNTDEFASTCNFARLLIDRLPSVLVELVQRLYDEKYFESLFLQNIVVFPRSDPPHFSVAMVNQCFDFFEQTLIKIFMKKPLVRVLVEQQPAVLQKTLLHLICAIYLARSSEGKLMRLHQYAYFCSRLTGNLKEPFFDDVAAFFIRDVCYSLLHLAGSDNDKVLSAACCKFLDLFLREILPSRRIEVQDVLRFVIANLISLAQRASSTEVALSLLNFLMVEQRDALREAIVKLGAFPNLEIFREIRESHNMVRYANGTVRLEEELKRFLDAMSDDNAECALEDLTNLTQQLSARQGELKELQQKQENQYSEDGVGILHQVIFKLVKLTESPNVGISMEATRCLGELGPTDSTTALRPSGRLIRETDHVIEALTYRSVAMLSNFLVKKDVELRKISSDALYTVLSTTCGRKLIDPKYTKNLSNIFHECVPLKVDYIRPFAHGRIVKEKYFSVNVVKLGIVMDPTNVLWTIKNNEHYVEWIVKVTCGIAECFKDSYLESFLSICQRSIEFCELVLPRIVCLVIQQCKSFNSTICDCINQFFRYHFATNRDGENAVSSVPFAHDNCDRKIVRCMLDVVNYVRTQLPDGVILKLDYINLARAAHSCAAYYTALLFAQLTCESFCTEYPDFSSDPKIDYIYKHHPQLGRMLQDIMQDTYLNISDPDAICDVGSSYLLDHNSRIQYYARTNSWDKVMLAQDIKMSNDNNFLAAKEMTNALHHSGLQYLQWRFLSNSKNDLDEKFSYECAWRLSNWDLLVSDTATTQNVSSQLRESLENAFYRHHYNALKCFHENDQRGIRKALESARKCVIRCLKVVSLESSKTVNEKLSQLRLLREIEQLSMVNSQEYPELLRRWNEHGILTSQFEYIEPILQQRIIMFQIKESLKADVNMQNAFFTTCLDLATVAENQENFPVAARALGTLARHRNLFEDLQNQLLYQESLLAWMKCDQIIARRLLRSLIEKKNLKFSLRAKVLRVYGDWMAETKSENPQAVIQKYYLESIESSNAIDEQTPDVIKNLHDTQVALARFADAQYEQIGTYMKSPTYESLKEYARTAGKAVTVQMLKNEDIKRAMIISHKQSTNDAAELESIAQERRKYLLQALKYYLKTLRHSEEHNLLIYRLVALWLDNMFDEEVNELLNELDAIPSFKFIPLVPQLAAHVSNNLERDFSAKIFDLLKRCTLEHPYHTLPVVLALKNLHRDNEYESGTVTKKEERRMLGAKKLLQQLADSSVRLIICEMENLSNALLSLAYWQPNKNKDFRYQIPRNQPISKIKDLTNVLLPTLNFPVRPSGNYDNVIGISSYLETCELVGGLNMPKKIICIGTDGIKRRQLVKGKDDLRQDAVMQQVFTVVNTLLRTCKETRKRNLRIRTYKVIPLTQRSGVLEWCENTVPIIATLTGSKNAPGLHEKYYPRDMNVETARAKMKNVAQESNEVKLKVFLECCKRLRPAFQHFFEEKYVSPETWVERTLTFTRSVATTSIAGYILGLGDRHLNNILIDERTAEVVHIDFGIAFEQGKVLPVPETIPFRLTRDIEVAMGVSGIEGTMRRSCEVTMTMLRDQRQIIITLLQVLLYDPLFTWAITPEKACKMQNEVVKGFSKSERVPVETNKIAKRALLRVEQKLRGTEDGLIFSVPGQVERLLQEARDPANLSRLYCGWQPYL